MQPQFKETLQNDLFYLGNECYLVAVTANTVSSGVHRACLKASIQQDGRGCYGFRHSYARRRFQELAIVEEKRTDGTYFREPFKKS